MHAARRERIALLRRLPISQHSVRFESFAGDARVTFVRRGSADASGGS